jgi:exopolysaccharide biosynthesis WecB/TagA/CpsF family protein
LIYKNKFYENLRPLIKILDFGISNISIDEIIEKICYAVNNNDKLLITYLNAYVVTFFNGKDKFHSLINKFHIVHPDGVGMYLASKFLYKSQGLESITTGTDLYFKLLDNENTFKFFILGGGPDCRELIQKNSVGNTNKFKFVGNIYKPNHSIKNIQIINNSGADILMVALGTPFQEEWIIQYKDEINVPVIIAVGSGLDFLSGAKKRSPLWMRKMGLEWFFRLFQEPKRLWKRYVFGIPVFMFNIVLLKVKLLFKKEST